MKKKFLLLFMAFVMAFVFMPEKAHAENYNSGSYYLEVYYDFEECVSPYPGMTISADMFKASYNDNEEEVFLPEGSYHISEIECLDCCGKDEDSAVSGYTLNYPGEYRVYFEAEDIYADPDVYDTDGFFYDLYIPYEDIEGFSVTTSKDGFLYKWNPLEDAAEYRVSISFENSVDDDDLGYSSKMIPASSGTSYLWKNLKDDISANCLSRFDRVYYSIEAYDVNGHWISSAESIVDKAREKIIEALGSTAIHTHTYPSAWTITQNPTVFAEGIQMKVCSSCNGAPIYASIPKLAPSIKLSFTKKTLKKKKSAVLTVGKMATGDYVASVKSSNKKIVKVKKSNATKFKLTGIKKGKATITVRLASGKTAKCKVTVK